MSDELSPAHVVSGITPGPIVGHVPRPREIVCIQVDKVYDACSQRHCFEDITFCFPVECEDVTCRVYGVEVSCQLTQFEEEPPLVLATVDLTFVVEVECDSQVMSRTIVASMVSDEFPKQVILFGSAEEMFCAVEPVLECLGCDVIEATDGPWIGNDGQHSAFARGHEVDIDSVDFDEGEGEGGIKTIVSCDIGLFLEIKTAANVQLLIPSYGFCPVPPECEELPFRNRCEEFLEGPPPRRFFPQPFQIDID